MAVSPERFTFSYQHCAHFPFFHSSPSLQNYGRNRKGWGWGRGWGERKKPTIQANSRAQPRLIRLVRTRVPHEDLVVVGALLNAFVAEEVGVADFADGAAGASFAGAGDAVGVD